MRNGAGAAPSLATECANFRPSWIPLVSLHREAALTLRDASGEPRGFTIWRAKVVKFLVKRLQIT